MSTIATIEDALITAIKDALPGVKVETMPGTDTRPVPRPQIVWLFWKGARFQENSTLTGLTQEIEHTFYIVVVNKSLRSEKQGMRGAYEIVEEIRSAVAGLSIEGVAGDIEYKKEECADFGAGIFTYVIEVSVKDIYRK